MLELMLMRHAKSDWSRGPTKDFDRPLNSRGIRNAPGMGRYIAQHAFEPDLVCCSTANRARQTADLVLPAYDTPPKIVYSNELYLATVPDLRRIIGGMDNAFQKIMVIGHNPGLSGMASHLSGEHFELPTAAVVRLTHDGDDWSGAVGVKSWRPVSFWRPREVLKQKGDD